MIDTMTDTSHTNITHTQSIWPRKKKVSLSLFKPIAPKGYVRCKSEVRAPHIGPTHKNWPHSHPSEKPHTQTPHNRQTEKSLKMQTHSSIN